MDKALVRRASVIHQAFNPAYGYPYNLRPRDFESTMADVYDFLYDLNVKAVEKGWGRFEDILQLQALSNVLSNMLGTSLAKHSRELVVNTLPNGHPDLIRRGMYPDDKIAEAEDGVEVKVTRNNNASVDMHSAREHDLCTFVYQVDRTPGVPWSDRNPLIFTGVFLGHVVEDDYRRNERGERGTRTASLHAMGLAKYRANWVYMTDEMRKSPWCRKQLDLPLIGRTGVQ